MIATTFGRHYNDQVTRSIRGRRRSSCSNTAGAAAPSTPRTGRREIITQGPSLWGHERYWLTREQRDEARELRISNAEQGYRIPLNVMDGNYKVARDVCPWWDATAPARKTG